MKNNLKHNTVTVRIIYWAGFIALYIVIFARILLSDEDDISLGFMTGTLVYFFVAYIIASIIRKIFSEKFIVNSVKDKFEKYSLDGTRNLLSGSYEGSYFKIYLPKTSSGQVEIVSKIKIKSPHIFLDSTHFEVSSQKSSTLVFPEKYRISLEGNFDEFLKLYANYKDAQDILDILSPDLMEKMIKSSNKFDIELYGDEIKFIAPATSLVNDEIIDEMIEALVKINENINFKSLVFSNTSSKNRMPSKNYFKSIRATRIPPRHKITILFTATGYTALILGDYYNSIAKSHYAKELDLETIIIGSIGLLIITGTVYLATLLLSRYRYSEPRVLFRIGTLQVTIGWLLVMSLLLSIHLIGIFKYLDAVDYDNSLDVYIERDSQDKLEYWLEDGVFEEAVERRRETREGYYDFENSINSLDEETRRQLFEDINNNFEN